MLLAAFAVSFITVIIAGRFYIPFMRKKKLGQSILEEGPKWHMSKQGTPTMGGILFIAGVAVAGAVTAASLVSRGDYRFLIVFVFALCFGFIGFLDDYVKVAKKRNLGLTATQKLLLQIALSILCISVLRYLNYITPELYIPFVNRYFELNWIWFMIFSVLVCCATVNAVNFSDGVDGHLSCVTIPVMIFFLVFAVLRENLSLSVFSAAMIGGLVGFLVYNFNPAKVFMGDTGSLFLGGVVYGLALALGLQLIIPLIGIIYMIEMLSVVMQVTYFKATKGKRIFKMTPIHHHFEMVGWSEKKICAVSTSITAVMCVIAYFATAGLI